MRIEAMAQLASGGKAGMTVHDNERIRYAVIEADMIVNIIIGPADWAPEGMTLIALPEDHLGEIGSLYADGVVVPPSAPVEGA